MRQLLDEVLLIWRAAEAALDALDQWDPLVLPLQRAIDELRRDYRRIVAAGDATESERTAIRARIAEAHDLIARTSRDS